MREDANYYQNFLFSILTYALEPSFLVECLSLKELLLVACKNKYDILIRIKIFKKFSYKGQEDFKILNVSVVPTFCLFVFF